MVRGRAQAMRPYRNPKTLSSYLIQQLEQHWHHDPSNSRNE
jgi:hypothetical protein